jgi:hypothetical protein
VSHGGHRPRAGRRPRAATAATVPVMVRLTPERAAALDAALRPGETRQDAIRAATDAEIARRTS